MLNGINRALVAAVVTERIRTTREHRLPGGRKR